MEIKNGKVILHRKDDDEELSPEAIQSSEGNEKEDEVYYENGIPQP